MEAAQRGYLARSWAMLTRDAGWWKPLLVLPLALLVPVAGVLGVIGYGMEWARLTAWGVDSAPKQRNVSVGGCIAAGWRAFVPMLVWGLVWGLVLFAVDELLNLPSHGFAVELVGMVVNAFLYAIVMVAALRAALYQRVTAGLRPGRVIELIRADPQGFLRVYGICLLWFVVTELVGAVVGGVLLAAAAAQLGSLVGIALEALAGGTVASSQVVWALAELLRVVAPLAVALAYVWGVIGSAFVLLCQNACGLWLRDLDVPSWGGEADPLPDGMAHGAAPSDSPSTPSR